jgi:hypothetical protein
MSYKANSRAIAITIVFFLLLYPADSTLLTALQIESTMAITSKHIGSINGDMSYVAEKDSHEAKNDVKSLCALKISKKPANQPTYNKLTARTHLNNIVMEKGILWVIAERIRSPRRSDTYCEEEQPH